MLNLFNKYLPKNPTVRFLLLFILLFIFIYGIAYTWAGLTTPGNRYSPFLANNLNYIQWLRETYIHSTILLSKLFGFNAEQLSDTKVAVINGHGVHIDDNCIGFGLMSVWAAFAISYPTSKKRKLKWLFYGLLLIWFINVIRILTLLLLVNQPQKIDVNKFGDHHDLYNYFAYAIIIAMIFFYTKEKKQTSTPTAPPQNPS